MKKVLLGFATAALFTTQALAADLGAPYYKAPPSPPPPVYNWTGFYVGGLLGYGWANAVATGAALLANALCLIAPTSRFREFY